MNKQEFRDAVQDIFTTTVYATSTTERYPAEDLSHFDPALSTLVETLNATATAIREHVVSKYEADYTATKNLVEGLKAQNESPTTR